MEGVANISEDDQDSLFGSPPPSPARGRSPPRLALPGCTGAPVAYEGNASSICMGNTQKNVGTIALPGSHMSCSELPVNMPALPLNGSSTPELSQSHRQGLANIQPRVPPQTQAYPNVYAPQSSWSGNMQYYRSNKYQPALVIPNLSSPLPQTSSSALQTHLSLPSTATQKRKRAREKSSAPRPPPPPIVLPNPNGPPPQNFLRNQQALLGVAGLVGGIRPANLSVHRPPRGSTPSNPIVVEDELNPPPLGKNPRVPAVDPAQLPTPSSDDIIASLMRQKNIFPVLESLIKLVAPGAVLPPPPPPPPPVYYYPTAYYPSYYPFLYRNSNDGPSLLKRRKLSNVPAGAADWDVPYPFQSGEGPAAYRANWERERGRQLLTQLITLIKGAAQNAALKSYFQQLKSGRREDEQTVLGGKGPSMAMDGSDEGTKGLLEMVGKQEQAVTSIDQNEGGGKSSVTEATDNATNSGTQQPSTPFDQLIASLLSGSQTGVPENISRAPGSSTPSGSSEGCTTPIPGSSTPGFDQPAFERWLTMLQAYPPPPETTEQGSTVSVERSTMNNEVEALDLTKSDLPDAAATSESFQSQSLLQHTNLDSQMESSSHPATTGTASGISAEAPICNVSSIQDYVIDPTLLAISIPESSQLSQLHSRQSMSTSSSATSPTPDLAFSPLASISSLADPPTPSRDDSLAEPGVYNGEQDPLTAATTLLQFAATSTPSSATPMPYRPVLSTYQPIHPQPLYSSFGQNSQAQVPLTQKRTFVGPGRAAPRNVGNKEDTIRRARERRRQLVAEVERAKVELWETSIEGGVLMQLAKDNN